MQIARFENKSTGRRYIGARLPAARDPAADSPELSFLAFTHEAALGEIAPESSLAWFDEDGEALPQARRLYDAVLRDGQSLAAAGAVLPSSELRLLAPIARPGKFICIGLNYRDHALESGMGLPERPLVFSKFSSCVIGPEDEVRIPEGCNELDYEAEFAFVIGKRATRVPEERAFDHVLGYTCVNDVSARDFQFADGQWQRGKSCDTFAPLGPVLVTRDEIPDPHRLSIEFRRNGETLQASNTDQLIFGVATLVAEISRHVTLEAGDVISTGTPPGVGFARKPPIYLENGDCMEVVIEGIGTLRNTVVG